MKIFKYQLPAFLWAIFIFVLCTADKKDIKTPHFFDIRHADKIVHAIIFMILSYLLLRGFRKDKYFSNILKSTLVISFFISLVYGVFIELFQHYCKVDRSGDVWDLVADGVGCVAGILIFGYLNRKLVQ